MESALRELAEPAEQGLFGGGSEMARAMAAKDWSATAVGSPEHWPAALRTAVEICLSSRFPICMTWGPDYTTFYNDAYLPIIGALRHPRYLGGSFKECWSEIWDVIGPMIDGVLATGQATYSEDLLLLIARSGHLEEAYFTFSYSPIRDGGAVRGMFCAVSETTERVLGERRLLALRELAATTLDARDAE